MAYYTTIIVHVLFMLLSVLLLLPSQDLYLTNGENTDEVALWEFRKAIEVSENVLSTWNSSADVCGWIGISCNLEGRVFKLELANRSLNGSISPFLSNLSQLQRLDLSYNFLRGSIPDSFGMLANLEDLNLTHNDLYGKLPTSIFYNCTQLKWVHLDYNHLNGSIPLQIGTHLHGLEFLSCASNYLTGSIPTSLSNLSQLQRLDLSYNALQGSIPDSFGMLAELEGLNFTDNKLQGKLHTSIFYNCTQLKWVHLGYNTLSGSIPLQIGTHLHGLEFLSLAANFLTGSIPASLSNATNLRIVYLDGNFLNGPLPSDAVAQFPSSLQSLSISYNSFSSDEQGKDFNLFLKAVSNLTHLTELGVGGNDLRGTLDSMAGLVHVNLILLQENKIYGMIPSNISNLRNLTTLNLSQNLLVGTVPEELFLLPMLERTFLNDNLLNGELPSLPNVPTKFGILDLSRNKLSGKIPSSISNLNSMRELLLSENSLVGSIPPNLGSIKVLELLDLSHNKLTGPVPAEVASLSSMAWYLNLSHNLLDGELSGEWSKMDKVQDIVLSSNKFNGTIPPAIGRCIGLQLLNLSDNSLQGPIPESFGKLRNLQSLDLSSNSLSGGVPTSLQQCTSLTRLNLSFNQLSGAIPHGGVFDSLTFESLEGNNLCGLEKFPSCPSTKRSITHSQKLLLLLVSTISSTLFFLIIFCIRTVKTIRGAALDASRHSIELFNSHWRITYKELWEATGGFDQSRLIGSGGFGHVYRGTLSDGSLLAIKVLQLQDNNSLRIFNRECQVLKRIRHRNLMTIITACSLPEFKALVLPFMSKGSLEDHLYLLGHRDDSHLSLIKRVSICGDVAEGMAYLHHHAPVQVIHCDLKPSNILLSDDMTAVVSDFGIARLISTAAEGNASVHNITNSTTNFLHGSVGYVAPEYGYGRSASAKGDVYSFGIVVLEIVTGKRPTDDMFSEGLSLINWVKYQYRSQLENIIDSSLVRDLKEQSPEVKKILEAAILELIDLGILCTQEAASARPTMISVADDLNKLKLYLGSDATSTLSLGMTSVSDIRYDW